MRKKKVLPQILQEIGLSEKEAMVYLELLELNESIPSAISRKTDLKRSTTYAILEQLQKKGLVSHVIKDNHLCFRALDPRIFLKRKRDQYRELRDWIDNLETILPEVQNLHSDFTVTPQMSVFRGKEGLIQIMEDSLKASGELLCWGNIWANTKTLLQDYYPKYIEKRVKKGILLKGIFPYEEGSRKFKEKVEKELCEVYFIPKEKCPFENEINIYDNKLAIISHKDETGVIIENKSIANTQKAIFNFSLDYVKQLEEERKKRKAPPRTKRKPKQKTGQRTEII